MPSDQPVTGSCLCGRVRLRVARLGRDVIYCHCSQCRKQSGHHYAATDALASDVRIESDGDALAWYAASDVAKRGFCRHCGSALFWKPNAGERISILAGCLDSPTGLVAKAHIYVADKGDYYTLDDALPQHAQSD